MLRVRANKTNTDSKNKPSINEKLAKVFITKISFIFDVTKQSLATFGTRYFREDELDMKMQMNFERELVFWVLEC